ncbi:TraV family lipoprotein [Enterobacter asburiae]
MIRYVLPLLAGVCLLAGCAGAKSDFGCNATSTDNCMTIDAANRLARQKAKAAAAKPDATRLPAPAESGRSLSLFNAVRAGLPGPVRLPEGNATVWVAPWVDSQDSYHEPGRLSFVVNPGEWHP